MTRNCELQYINSAGHSSQRTDVFLSVRWIRMDSLDPLPSQRGVSLWGSVLSEEILRIPWNILRCLVHI